MMRILLSPLAGLISEVDVVSKCLLFAALKIGAFEEKTMVTPVLIESHVFGNTHGVDKLTTTGPFATPRTDNPISYRGRAANDGFAGG